MIPYEALACLPCRSLTKAGRADSSRHSLGGDGSLAKADAKVATPNTQQ